MLSISDAAAIAAAPMNASIDPDLRQLLADRVHDWTVTDLLTLTHVLILPAGSTEKDIEAETGYSPLVNPLDGSRFGSPSFIPPFDWLQQHGRWAELIQTVSNDGWALVLFIELTDETDAALRSLCLAYEEDGERP